MEDEINWASAHTLRDIHNPKLPPREPPKVDEEASKVAGKRILVNDPRLIKLVLKWKKEHNPDEDAHYLKQEKYRNELIEEFKNYG